VVDDDVAFEEIEVLEIELAAARQDEHAEQVCLPTHFLNELSRNMERRMRNQMNDRVALVPCAKKSELGRELGEDPCRVASALAFEPENVRGRELSWARPLDVVEA
jgi:hypothetical protein